MSDVERRTFGTVAMVEEPEGERAAGDKKKPKKMVGYAARYNSMSEDLGGFREIILPGAFDRALREGHDVHALVNHNPDFALGRTGAGGTLALAIDSQGLRVEISPPDTQLARDVVANVEAGIYTQMSFAFRTLTDDWRTQDGEVIRELIDLELFDVSVVARPAYRETSVSARTLERAKEALAPPAAVREEPVPELAPADPEPKPEPEGGLPLHLAELQHTMNGL